MLALSHREKRSGSFLTHFDAMNFFPFSLANAIIQRVSFIFLLSLLTYFFRPLLNSLRNRITAFLLNSYSIFLIFLWWHIRRLSARDVTNSSRKNDARRKLNRHLLSSYFCSTVKLMVCAMWIRSIPTNIVFYVIITPCFDVENRSGTMYKSLFGW